MRTRRTWLSAILVVFGLGVFGAGGLHAQTSSAKVESRNFEVLAVDGNRLVYRDQNGTHEITPPDDFRLTVDGRKLAVKELKPGMKGTAIVTRTTTTTPVIVTEFRDAVVLSTTPNSVTVRGADGVRRFTQAEIDKRGIEIFKDGRLIRVSQLNKGDQLTGTIISSQPPTIVTETEVEAKLATAKAEPAPPAPAKAEAAPAAPAATPPATVASATPAAPSAPPMKAAPPPEQSQSWLLWAAILIAIAVVVYLLMRKKKS